ncbi:MAG: FemAB family PEP-CTERM system-associated protein [Candidatus Brocadiaceae bacterium]|nr:FemAB family PEP-CTERM system-associated protein [Candidatus Brocadiaceae bacterium]
MVDIAVLDGTQNSSWDEYVDRHDDSTFFHLSGWKNVIEKSFGHEPYYLLAYDNNIVVGVFPLFYVNSILFGKTLASTPFCVYGGILSDNKEITDSLIKHAMDLSKKLNVDAIEIRNIQKQQNTWIVNQLYYRFRKVISDSNDDNLKSIPRKQRAMVRKGIKSGLVSEHTTDYNRLFRIYSESLRNLGTPVFTKKYLNYLMQEFKDKCDILMIKNGDKDIAGVMSFYFKNEVIPYYGGSITEARSVKANDFMYWELMRRSAKRGISIFDFGRSKEGTGSYSFKKNWGFTPEPLHYQYNMPTGKSMPEINPMNPKYQIFIKLWKKLPLGIANTFGPYLAKDLG